jgi:protein tyrosine phosphatase (PTP) superfamily phosphohydrolase (DUF442 family)
MLNQGIAQIKNFIKISERIGTAGQPTEAQFSAIKDAGYEVVINLAMPTSTNAISNEGELVTSQGMEYVHIPVQWEAPTAQDLDDFFHVMKANQSKKVFVHCALNMRVSAFIYLFRVICQGVRSVDAAEQLHQIWEPDKVWQEFIQTTLARRSINTQLPLKP